MPTRSRGKARAVPSTPTQSAQVQSIIEHLPTAAPNSAALIKTSTQLLRNQDMVARLNSLEISDMGNAEAFTYLFRNKLLYCMTRKCWLLWTGNTWKPRANDAAMLGAMATIRARSSMAEFSKSEHLKTKGIKEIKKFEKLSSVKAVLEMSLNMEGMKTDIAEFDTDSMLIGARNGVIDLRTGEFRRAKPEDRISMQLGCDYDALATYKLWIKFLREIFNNNEEVIRYLKRAIGYSLTGSTIEQKIFFCFGDGLNGKSRLLQVIERVLGDYAGSVGFRTLDYEKRSQIGEDLASLKGKRFVTIIETPDDRRIDEARVKSLTGEDTITCRFLHSNPFSYIPTYKIWMAMNYRPLIKGIDKGIWRRIREIPFTQNFEGRADARLEEKLLGEMSGILNWAIEGALEWQREGLGKCKVIEDATEAYKRDSDHLGKWVEENLVSELGADLISAHAYDDYKEWALARRERPWTSTTWGKVLGQMGFKSHRPRKGTARVTCYQDVRFRRANDPD